MYTKLINKLKELEIDYKLDEALKSYTTWKIGGPADIFVEAKTREDLIRTINTALDTGTKYIILGWGSNVLISDKGVRGLVIRNLTNELEIYEATEALKPELKLNIEPRLIEVDREKYYSIEDLEYDESDADKVKVNIESGAFLPATIMQLIRQDITGLQWFGGIPGTLGGAIYNNIHGGNHYISEFIARVEILDPESRETHWLSNRECEFDYDYSRFHKTKEIIVSADLILFRGDTQKAKSTYIEWTRRKKKQPQISAGCVWRNLDEHTAKELGLESNSWGYIIDKVLKLKGKQIGGAKISEAHAAFIENTGNAKAQDVVALMELIKTTAKSKLGVTPTPEIFLLGDF